MALVAVADPSLSLEQVGAAVDAAVRTGAALRSVTTALQADPAVLHSGAPPAVGRLVQALVTAGSSTLDVPACTACGRSGRPLTRSPSGGVCAACRHRQTATACASCDVVKPVAGRDEAGNAICETCRRRHRPPRRCGLCGQTRTIARRARNGEPDVCTSCYRLPCATCHRCGRDRPCNFAEGDRPVCKPCAPKATAACARCGADRPPSVRWPEGPVCERCYRAALHQRGTCDGCQQTRRLVDPPRAQATRCADCAGVAVPNGHVCGDCGIEDRLYERGRCVRCALTRRTRELLTDPATGDVPAALAPVAAAITATLQPYSAHNWLRTGAGAAILVDLAAGRLPLDHDALDAHPQPGAAQYLRHMLTAHGVLDERDEELARVERWVVDLLEAIARPADRRLLNAYATWRVLRRLRRRAEHTTGPRTPTWHAKTLLRAAVGLLDWLAERDLTLAQARQGDIDAWLATGPAAYHARDFLLWAGEHGHCHQLTVRTPGRRSGVALDPEQRWALLARLLHDDTLELPDRVAGCLLLCYGQQLSRITALTTDQVTVEHDRASIRFGAHDVHLPEPLAGLVNALLDQPRTRSGIGAPPTSRWLFPGHHPGRPLSPAHLGVRLRRLGIPTMASRRAALLHLAAELPAAVLADLLNLSIGTAVGWVNNAAGDWNRYAAALARQALTDTRE